MGRSTHRVTLSDGRFLKFYTAGSNGGDTVMRLTFSSLKEYEQHVNTEAVLTFETGYRTFWIKAELASLRQRVEALENIKRLAEHLSEALDEFGCEYPDAWGESQNDLDNAIVDYHDQCGKRWPKMPRYPYSHPQD